MNQQILNLVEQEIDTSIIHKDDMSAAYQKSRMFVECSTDGHIQNKDQLIATNMIVILKEEYNAPSKI